MTDLSQGLPVSGDDEGEPSSGGRPPLDPDWYNKAAQVPRGRLLGDEGAAAGPPPVTETDRGDTIAVTPAVPDETIEMLSSAASMAEGVTALLENNVALGRQVDAAFRDPDFGARVTANHPDLPEINLDDVRANIRAIIERIGKRPSDKNAAIRWANNFWQVAKTSGLISVLGFGLRTGIQSGTAQSLNLGQPDAHTGTAEAVYYGGQGISTIMMLASAVSNAKDGNQDALIGDLIYASSMISGAGFAYKYDLAASLVTSTAGAAFYASFTEILKTFRTMKVPQLAGVSPTGWRKVGAYAAGATAFTLSFIPATGWSYSKDFTGGGGFEALDAADRARKGAMIGLLWGGALVGYNVFTPPLTALAAGNESGPIAPLEYDAKWKSNLDLLKKPKELLKTALAVANDANKFFAFVLVFNTYLGLIGGTRLGPSGEDAIPNEALRIFANTVISSVVCQVLCYVYEMQYGTKTEKSGEVLADGSPGHRRVQAALAAFRAEVDEAAAPVPAEDLAEIIGRHTDTLQSSRERALFTVLVYTDAVPRAIEEERISPVPSRAPTEAAESDRAHSPPPEDAAPPVEDDTIQDEARLREEE